MYHKNIDVLYKYSRRITIVAIVLLYCKAFQPQLSSPIAVIVVMVPAQTLLIHFKPASNFTQLRAKVQ